jgi:hypothetical protein
MREELCNEELHNFILFVVQYYSDQINGDWERADNVTLENIVLEHSDLKSSM